MKIALFSAKAYDRDYFELANQQFGYDIDYFEVRLDARTARLAHQTPVVCAFVNDDLSRPAAGADRIGRQWYPRHRHALCWL